MSERPATNPSDDPRPRLPEHPLVYGDVLELIHDTPLLRLDLEECKGHATLWGKLESFNPGGSVKDRICLAMILRAESEGLLRPGGVVVEPTSGNTGIGLALVCRQRGYRCLLTMPESMSLERRALLETMGAEVVLTPAEQQMTGAIAKAEELARQYDGFIPHQFDNSANPEVHATHTARELLHAMEGLSLDVFVAGVGTGGTVAGVGRVLREQRPHCRIVAVEPDSCATLSRGEVGPSKIQGWAAGFIPANYDASVVHEIRTVTDRDAYQMKWRLARECGLLVGISSGGAVSAAVQMAQALGPEQNVVVVLPDTGERYFSLDEYFDE